MTCKTGNCGNNLFRELDRSLNRLVRSVQHNDAAALASPGMSVSENADTYLVELDLPGVAPGDVSVEIDEGIMTITGERKIPNTTDGHSLIINERSHGKFQRRLQLAADVVSTGVDAEFGNGVLRITIQRQVKPSPHKVVIRTQQI